MQPKMGTTTEKTKKNYMENVEIEHEKHYCSLRGRMFHSKEIREVNTELKFMVRENINSRNEERLILNYKIFLSFSHYLKY